MVEVAQQLKALYDTAAENCEEAQHLFQRLQSNALLITAALQECLSSPSADLRASIQLTLEGLVGALITVRNAVYNQLLANRRVCMGQSVAIMCIIMYAVMHGCHPLICSCAGVLC